jgi:hypothetical protein
MTAIRTVMEASMSEPAILTIVCFVILSATLIISEKVRVSRVEEAACQIVQELRQVGAYDLFSAIELPQARGVRPRVGYRNFWPDAVPILVQQSIVRRTGAGKLYLRKRLGDYAACGLPSCCSTN